MIALSIDPNVGILKNMVTYTLLAVLFVAVLGFSAWRIIIGQTRAVPSSDDPYVCSVCNEQNCECHRKNDDRQ
jgi:hypothetical protein